MISVGFKLRLRKIQCEFDDCTDVFHYDEKESHAEL